MSQQLSKENVPEIQYFFSCCLIKLHTTLPTYCNRILTDIFLKATQENIAKSVVGADALSNENL